MKKYNGIAAPAPTPSAANMKAVHRSRTQYREDGIPLKVASCATPESQSTRQLACDYRPLVLAANRRSPLAHVAGHGNVEKAGDFCG